MSDADKHDAEVVGTAQFPVVVPTTAGRPAVKVIGPPAAEHVKPQRNAETQRTRIRRRVEPE